MWTKRGRGAGRGKGRVRAVENDDTTTNPPLLQKCCERGLPSRASSDAQVAAAVDEREAGPLTWGIWMRKAARERNTARNRAASEPGGCVRRQAPR